jgi:hypothetical protein
MPRHEITLQVSDGAPIDIVWALGQAFTSWNEDQIEVGGTPLHIGAGYMYNISNRFSAGMELSFQSIKKTYRLTRRGSQQARGRKKLTAFLIMPKAKLTYVNGRIVQFYGDLAAGVGIINSTNRVENGSEGPHEYNTTTFAFQLNPIALRVGRRIGGFLKLGFGFQGFVTAGVSMKF